MKFIKYYSRIMKEQREGGELLHSSKEKVYNIFDANLEDTVTVNQEYQNEIVSE